MRSFVAVLLLVLAIVCARAESAEDDLKFETSAFMRGTAYRNVPRLNPEMAPDGAYGSVNRAWDMSHAGAWYIEEQRYGGDLVAGGIAGDDTGAIDRGLTILRWGFQQQQPDGGFRCPDAFHSTSFFVEAAAHVFLLLEASHFAAQYRPAIEALKPKLGAAARWMTRPENEIPGRQHNTPYTHRRYLVAAALGKSGTLLNDPQLIARSADYIREGLTLQDPSGFNLERGGWDSSYHAVGMLFAERYYTIVADGGLRPALYRMLEKAARWEASRIGPEGEIVTEGNTRVGGVNTEQGRSGKLKTVAAGSVYRALYYWSRIAGDQHFAALAEKVAAYMHQKHGPPSKE